MKKLIVALFIALTPLGAFAQSIVWQTEIAGQMRTIQSRDDRVRLIAPSASASQWRTGKQTEIGTVTKVDRSGAEVVLTSGTKLRDAIDRANSLGVSRVAPVFIEQGDAGQTNRAGLREYLLTNKILVAANSEAAARKALAISGAQSFYPTIAQGRWMLVFKNARAVIDGYAALKAKGVFAQPQFAAPGYTRAAPNDALYPQQWHLKNTGQAMGVAGIDANVEPVWDGGNRGSGQVISIVDDGLDLAHPDLAPNVLALGGDFATSNHWNFNAEPPNNNPGDLTRTGKIDDHGTSCGGVAAARQNNTIGVSGSAPEANLVGLRLIAGNFTDEDAANALGWRPALVTVSSNSWGNDDDNSVTASGPDVMARAALVAGVTSGRGGKGIVFDVAGGNGGTPNYRDKGPGVDESNYDAFANSPYVIGIAGNNDKGVQNFSETGCNIMITAPTGGEGDDQNITTTGLVGLGNIMGNMDYVDSFGGTSSSTPLVSGVVALMLTANPELGWRDVKEILIRTARKIDDTDGGYTTNGAGLPFRFSNRYGAGMVDAMAAVAMTQGWTNLGPIVVNTRDSGAPALDIPDNSETGVTRTFDFTGTNMRVEFVQFTVTITHPFRGELEYTLTSPSGMKAVVNRRTNDNTANLVWTFGDTQHWGEQSDGMWTLKVADRKAGNTGTFNYAGMTIYGTSPTATSATKLGNISTRLKVETGSNVGIGGVIVTGTSPKRVMLRGIGPSLPLTGGLADPMMELFDSMGTMMASDDNWHDEANEQEIMDSGLAPANDKESAILMTLNPGLYTAIEKGANETTGIGLVEAYDLDNTVDSKLGNISTRGFVQTGDEVMIGGFIISGTDMQRVIVRAIGPSVPLEGTLADPSLELHGSDGALLLANDNWRTTQETEIMGTGLAPMSDAESAIVQTLAPGSYTTIVRGVNDTTGVALVEVYALPPSP